MSRERVVVLTGPRSGSSVEVVGTLTIGRSHESGLQINDPQISRKHAVVQQTPAGTFLRDMGSGNGTYIGGRRILEHKLSDGDVITVGGIELRFETIPEEPPKETIPDRSVVFKAVEESSVRASAAASIYQTFCAGTRTGTSEQLREARARLGAVYEATQIISSERDINKLLTRVMDQLFGLVPAHNGVILLADPKTRKLATEYVKTGSGQKEVTISSSIVRRAFEHKEAVITYDAASDSRFGAGASIIAQRITSAMCVPLEHQEETLGALYVDTRGTTNAFSHSDLELMVALARAAAIAIRNAQYLAEVEKAFHNTLIVLANAIELRDHYTVGHTWRVTHFAVEVARKLGWDEDKLRECEMGGILHDVGKIGIPDAILGKPGGLTDEEFAMMKVHPERGARMLQDVPSLVPLIPYALYHHERWDGAGYPFGLAGENIPIEGRVIAVADTYDAMTSNRPYRKGMAPEVAIEEIQRKSGIQFDPACVLAIVESYNDGSLNKVMQNYYEKDGRSFACPFCSTFIRVPDHVQANDEIHCSVCHRRILLLFRNEAFYGELLPETEGELVRSTDSET